MSDPLDPIWAEDEINRLKERVATLEAAGRDILREVHGLLSTPAEERLASVLEEEADR